MLRRVVMANMLRSSYSEFFPEYCYSRFNEPFPGYVVSNCLFTSFVSVGGNGGAIFFQDKYMNLLVEDCTARGCYCTISGGFLYFSSSTGACVVNRVCGINCTHGVYYSSHGQFTYVYTSAVRLNNLLMSSFIQTTPFVSTYTTSYLGNGNQTVKSYNSSDANVYQSSSFNSVAAQSLLAAFITAVNNRNSYAHVVLINSGNSVSKLLYSNFFNNTVGTSQAIITKDTPQTNLENCVFILNNGPLLSGYLIVTNCFINHTGTLTFNTLVTIIGGNPASATFGLAHFATAFCVTPDEIITNPPVFLELSPCQTIPVPPTPPRTVPSCQVESTDSNTFLTLSSIIQFSLVSIINPATQE